MRLGDHLRFTGGALKRWLIAQTCDSLIVGILWFAGLFIVGVPLAPLWALVGAVLHFVPHFGPILALVGPTMTILFTGATVMRLVHLLMVYASIAVLDGLVLQPYLMKRTAKVPLWASILTPIALGLLLPFWGVLLAAPLLAVIYAYKKSNRK